MKDVQDTPKLSIGGHSKVIIPVQLDRGRWKKEEHELFLQGLEMYGRDWKKIERLVGTRTGPQIRSHAQKYFNKVSKDKGGISDTKSTIKLPTGPLSSSSSYSDHRISKLEDTTNLRQKKAEEKMKRVDIELNYQSNILNSDSSPSAFTRPAPSLLELNRANSNPLVLEEKRGTSPPNKLEDSSEPLDRKENTRMYTEHEVLMIIRSMVKEFITIMDKFPTTQQSLLSGNQGGLNLNSVLLLSLISRDQNKTSVTSSSPSVIQQNIHTNKLTSINNYQTPDLLSMLKRQVQREEVSSTNLFPVPKVSSGTILNLANLSNIHQMANISQLENSYNTISKLIGSMECKKNTEPVKKYENAETKYDSDTYPTLEVKGDQN